MSRSASRPIFVDETGNKRKVAPVYEGGYDDSQKVSLYNDWPVGQAYARVNPTLYFDTTISDPVYSAGTDYYRVYFMDLDTNATYMLDIAVGMPDIRFTDQSGTETTVWNNEWQVDHITIPGTIYISSKTDFSSRGKDAVSVGQTVDVDPEYNFTHKANIEDVPELYNGSTKVSKVTFTVSGSTLTITTE